MMVRVCGRYIMKDIPRKGMLLFHKKLGNGINMAKKMWQFKTRNLTVQWLIEKQPFDGYGLDPEVAAEWRKNIRSGEWKCFQSNIQVVCNHTGIVLGEAILSNSIYGNPADFRDHFGTSAKNYGSYFKQMVQEAVAEARERFPAHQAWIAKEVRQKQKVLSVKLKPTVTAKVANTA